MDMMETVLGVVVVSEGRGLFRRVLHRRWMETRSRWIHASQQQQTSMRPLPLDREGKSRLEVSGEVRGPVECVR